MAKIIKSSYIYKTKRNTLNVYYKDVEGESTRFAIEKCEELQFPGSEMITEERNTFRFELDPDMKNEENGVTVLRAVILWRDHSNENNFFVAFNTKEQDQIKGYFLKSQIFVSYSIAV